MRTRTAAALLPLVLLAPACSQAATVTDCAGLAADVARSGLSGVPTQGEAEQAVQRLEERVESLDSLEVKAAATDLRDRLRDLQEAAGSADPAGAARAADEARAAARRTAQVCGIPADQFLGG